MSQGQFLAATGIDIKGRFNNGKETKEATSTTWFGMALEANRLLGNTPAVAWRHYAQWADAYNDPLWEALGKKKSKKRAG